MLTQPKQTNRATNFIKHALLVAVWCLLLVAGESFATCDLSIQKTAPAVGTTSPFDVTIEQTTFTVSARPRTGTTSDCRNLPLNLTYDSASSSPNIVLGNIDPPSIIQTDNPTSGRSSSTTFTVTGFGAGTTNGQIAQYTLSCFNTTSACTSTVFQMRVAASTATNDLVWSESNSSSYIGLKKTLTVQDSPNRAEWNTANGTIEFDVSGCPNAVASSTVDAQTKSASISIHTFTVGNCIVVANFKAGLSIPTVIESKTAQINFQTVPIKVTAAPSGVQYTGVDIALEASLDYPVTPTTADRVSHTFNWATPTGMAYTSATTTASDNLHNTTVKHTQAGGKTLQVSLEENASITGSANLNATDAKLIWSAPFDDDAETINQGASINASTTMAPTIVVTNAPPIPTGSTVRYELTGANCNDVFLGNTAGTSNVTVNVSASGNAPVTINAASSGATTDRICSLTGSLNYPNATTPVASQTVTITVPGVTATNSFTLNKVSGDNQQNVPVNQASNPLVVSLLDGSTAPSTAQNIEWKITSGDAKFANGDITITTTTDISSGQTSVTVTPTDDDTITVTATYNEPSGNAQTVTFTFTADDIETLTIVTPQPPAGAVNTVSSAPMKVVTKENGKPDSGETITWTLLSGNLTLDATSTTTDANGESSLGFTHGSTAGTAQVKAELASDPSVFVVFDITTNAATVVSKTLTIGSPTPSNGTVGTYSSTPFLVIAKDDGNPAKNASINWSVIKNATLSDTTTQTNNDGESSNGFRFGNDVGDVIVEAVRADNPNAKVRFTLKATAKPEWKIDIIKGDDQTATINEQAPEELRVRVTKDGEKVSGIYVSWTTVDGQLSAKSSTLTTQTDDQGETGINYTPTKLGDTKVYATLNGGELAEFDIKSVAATSVQKTLKLYGATPQDGLVDTAGSSPLQVIAEDDGKPVSDVTINWQVVKNGQLDQTSTQTDSNGVSQNNFRHGSNVGDTVFVAQRSDAPDAKVTFTVQTKQPASVNYAISVLQGNGQTLPINSDSSELVVLTTANNQAQASVPVLFEVMQGSANFAFRDAISGNDGQARAVIKTGDRAGTVSVKATRTDTNQSVVFKLTVEQPTNPVDPTDPVSLTLTLTDGNNQNIAVNTPSEALQVTVTDDKGKPYSGATIEFETDARLGALTLPNGVTDGNGQASTQITLQQPSATTVIAKLMDAKGNELSRVIFSVNASFAVDQLPIGQRPIGQVFNNLCQRLAALEQRTPAQEDLLQRCREVGDGDNFADILENITGIEINGHATMTVARTQMNNIKARLDALKSGATGLDLRGLSVNVPNGSLSLGLLQDEQSNMSQDGNPDDNVFDRWGFFANGAIGQGKFDPKTNTRSYDFDINGITAGVDYRFRPNLVGGLALGFSKQDTTFWDGSTSKLTGYSGTAYLTWYNQQSWYVDGQLTYGINSFDVLRSIRYRVTRGDQVISDITQTGRGTFDATMFSGSLAAGRDFSVNGWNLNPYARYDYTVNRFDELKEDLAPENGQGLALTAKLDNLTSSALVAGGQATYNHSTDWGVLMPNLMIEYQRELNDDASTFEAFFSNDPAQERFRIDGTPLDRSYLRMGVGLSALFPGGRSAYIYYEYLRGEQLKMGNINLGMRWEF